MQNNRIRPPRQLHPALIALIDIAVIGACLCVFALFDHVVPHSGQTVAFTTPAPASPPTNAPVPTQGGTVGADATPTAQPTAGPTPAPAGDFSEKFAGMFTDGEIIQTENSYRSANLNVTVSRHEATYGNYREVYFIEDIYIRSIECLRTVFAQDTFGKSISEDVVEMSRRTNSIAAINSDYYGYGNAGIVIRNGVLYRSDFEPGEEVLIIFRDGTMKAYKESELNVAQAMAEGAWQSFSFGPSLLDENGDVRAEGYERVNHDPRTIIAMIEPGHYLFIVIDGRQNNYSDGMTYSGCASLCKELGCAVAYNLDGGRTSQMTFMGDMVNHPYKNGRPTSDLICITDTGT